MNDVPTVKLAEKEWPIPVLSIRQNRIVVPAVLAFMPIIARIMKAIASQNENPEWYSDIKLTTPEFDLMSEAIYVSLTKGTPGLARNEFDNMEVTMEEMFAALPMVAKQTGIIKQEAAGATQAGEAKAGVDSTSTS